MNFYAVINGVNSIVFFVLALIAFLTPSSKKTNHLIFGAFSLGLFFWSFFYFLWGIQTDSKPSLLFLKLLIYAVCLLHVLNFHFVLVFSDSLQKYKKVLLFGYVTSFIFLVLNFFNLLYDPSTARPIDSFLFWPKAYPSLLALIAVEVAYIALGNWILYKKMLQGNIRDKNKLSLFIIFNFIGWLGGLTNWVPFFDSGFLILPWGNLCVTFLALGNFYLVVRHDILALQIAVKRTFVYALLTLLTTMIYSISILLSERFFQSYIGYNSILFTILAGAAITLLFNPARSFLNKFLERNFFGKNIEELSIENLQMRLELQKQERMKAISTLAAGMAHEIKNPLTTIRTFADYLPEKYDDPEFRKKFQRLVIDEVDRVNNIVKQLLDFSKQQDPQLKPLYIRQVIDDTLELLSANLVRAKIRVERHYEFQGVVLADRHQMRQVFLNLILNSIQSMSSEGTLTLAIASANRSEALISIRDTGRGITAEDLPRVFEPFFTTHEGGTGLGLSIVYGIIESHGGRIKVDSHINQGTVFEIHLPTKTSHP